MNSPLPAPESAPAPRRNWTRRLVNLLVALVVAAVAAATFVFSYSGVREIALFGGVSTQLARYYPGLFDAVLVIACVAAVVLRDSRWWARLWAWVVIVVLLAAIAVTDVLHAMSYSLRPRPTEGIVAAAPVAAVLLAFSLLLTMLRQSRSQPQPAGPARRSGFESVPGTLDLPGLSVPLSAAEASTVEIPALAAPAQLRPPAPPIALPAAFNPPPPVAEAAVPMPAPEAASPAPTGVGAEPGRDGTAAQDTVPDIAPDMPRAPDSAATREEPTVAGALAAEPPTVLTPAVLTAPAVPGATPMPAAAVPEEAVPSGTSEPATVAVAEPARPTTSIRYAGGAARRAGRPEPDEAGTGAAPAEPAAGASDAAPPAAPVAPLAAEEPAPASESVPGEPASRAADPADYWDAEEAGPYAGLVYQGRDEHKDADDTGRTEGNGHAGDKSAGDEDGDGDSGSSQSPTRRVSPELDDDAPPFATAPFAPVPRLNRVRSMPAPPADDED